MATTGDQAAPARDAFRERARLEAARYGNDAWIFVRELLQNARDAGARRVEWNIAQLGDDVLLSCADDGEGMDLDHARRYLFSLYTSSKEGARDQIGCFGVGFWSILRFTPDRILISSCPRDKAAWAIELDGELRHAVQRQPPPSVGTKIVLVRAGLASDVVAQVARAVRENARFLTCRHDNETPLSIAINGEVVNERFELPRPSSQFRRAKLRGVVSLGPSPRVELLSGGLLVRSAVDLDELENKDAPTSSPAAATLPGGTCPVVLLDSPSLELLLARRDARQTRTLRRLVRLARRELRLLVARQIDRSRPPSVLERARGVWQFVFRDQPRRQFAAAAVLTSALGLLVLDHVFEPPSVEQSPVVDIGTPPPAPPPPVYQDLAARYRGPQVSPLAPSGDSPAIDLRYHPATRSRHIRVLAVDHLEQSEHDKSTGDAYRSTPCRSKCTSLELRFVSTGGYMRVPVPTGERLDTQSLRVDGRPVLVYRTSLDEPLVYFRTTTSGTLTYVTGPASPIDVARVVDTMKLPRALATQARALRQRSVGERVAALRTLTQARVAYRNDAAIVAAHEQARANGEGFISRTLAIAAGDCDVQNGLFVALLRAAGISARLAIGYVGHEGRVHPALHAWVEFRDGEGPWQVADASRAPTWSNADAPLVAANMPVPAGPLHIQPNPGTVEDAAIASSAPSNRRPPLVTASRIDNSTAETRRTDPRLPVDTHDHAATVATPTAPIVANPQQRSPTAINPTPSAAAAVDPTPPTDAPPVDPVAATSPPEAFERALQLTLLLLATALVGWRFLRRTRRALALDDGTDVAAMLTGALQRPELFRELPALMDRPLIPLLDRGAISLRNAMRLATTRQLYCASKGSELTKATAVVDTETSEGAAVATSLAATDLDRWHTWLSESNASPLADQLTRLLHERGERWMIKTSPALQRPVEMLDLRELGQRNRTYDRIVLVAEGDERVRTIAQQWQGRPAAAVFALADHVLAHLDLADERRRQLLAGTARAAVTEAVQ